MYSSRGLDVINEALKKHPDIWCWGARPFEENAERKNKTFSYTTSLESKQKSISFITRALDCKLNEEDLKTRIKFYSDPYSCPPLLDVAGKSMNINYNRTSVCVNNLCNQRELQAIGLKDMPLFDIEEILQLHIKSVKVNIY